MDKKEDIKKKAHIWRTFSLARAFVHNLRLKSADDWRDYCKSGKKPLDIPSNPGTVYRSEYKDMGDWLGTGNAASTKRHYLPFAEARAFVHALKFKNGDDWKNYCRSGKRPKIIPSNPNSVYRSEYKGVGDWLGTGTIATAKRHYLPFAEARAFVHALKFKSSKEWRVYCKSGNKPDDIPAFPNQVEAYRSEYKDWGDWLGTGNVASTKLVWRPFPEARLYVRNLQLKNQDEWLAYCRSGTKPTDIPAQPSTVYLAEFESYGDWLGTGTIATTKRHYRPFIEARAFVQKLGLNSEKQWAEYCRSGTKPPDIPSDPRRRYRGEYKSLEDWLGIEYLSFPEARAFAQKLRLTNHDDWLNYCRSGKKPKNIPSNPNSVYRSEYKGMKDWLGVVDKWNNATLLAFLQDLRPQLNHLDKRDLVAILEQDGAFRAFRKALGGATPIGVLNDLIHNEGRDLEQALREVQDHPREIETFVGSEPADHSLLQVCDHVFICYSHKDKKWLEKLQTMLTPLTREGKIKVWADTKIQPGSEWREEIRKALAITKVAVLLVTPNFLSSDFIAAHELPPLLEEAKKGGLVILWVAVSPSWYEETEIECYQAANEPSRPLAGLRGVKLNEELVHICKKIKLAVTG